MTILFPSSYKSIMEVDYDLRNEYEAVLDTGLFNIVFFEYNAWFHDGILRLHHDFGNTDNTPVLYRGWMMKPEQYTEFYKQCTSKGLVLVTTPEQYELFHIYPNIYPVLKENAVSMLAFPLHENINTHNVGQKLGRFMVKDFVKSVKGTDFPTYFEPDVPQDEFNMQMKKFYKYRGSLLTGGIVCKSFVDLKKYDTKPNEYRVFYANGEPVSICRNSNQPLFTKEPPTELVYKYMHLDSPFYTIDFAELNNESWVIIEAGDGQVSGPSPNQNLKEFYRSLYATLEPEKEREM